MDWDSLLASLVSTLEASGRVVQVSGLSDRSVIVRTQGSSYSVVLGRLNETLEANLYLGHVPCDSNAIVELDFDEPEAAFEQAKDWLHEHAT